MSTGFALIDRPNVNYTQGQALRRGGQKPVGLAVIHTFETAPDTLPPDMSAETGLAYLRSRDTPGCYHRLADSDSRIPIYPFEWETWHCKYTNRWSDGFCMATQAHRWEDLTPAFADALLLNCARDVAAFFQWMAREHAVKVPIRWLSREDALAKQPGMTMHRLTDPWRRKDPGFGTSSPRGRQFLQMVGDLVGSTDIAVIKDPLHPGLLLDGDFGEYTIKALQRALNNVGEDAGPDDGVFGERTKKAYQHWLARCGFYGGRIDGDFGCMSRKAEQLWLASHLLYNETISCKRDGLVVYALQQALNKGKIS